MSKKDTNGNEISDFGYELMKIAKQVSDKYNLQKNELK